MRLFLQPHLSPCQIQKDPPAINNCCFGSTDQPHRMLEMSFERGLKWFFLLDSRLQCLSIFHHFRMAFRFDFVFFFFIIFFLG